MKILLKNLSYGVSGIYKLTYPNGKIYIGQSVDIKRRMYEHNNINRLKNHYQSPCDLAILKYGKFEEIEILDLCTDKNDLNKKEKYWISFYHSNDKNIGYNLTEGGTNHKGLIGEKSSNASFSNIEVYDIRKRRFQGERKCNVYKDYAEKNFSTFEHIWLGRGYSNIGQEFLIKTNSISRQEYSSNANAGENNNKAKLTVNDVKEIRQRYDKGESPIDIHKDFDFVNLNSIRRVCKRETWKNV